MAEEEAGFSFVDKRRVNPGAEPVEETQTSPSGSAKTESSLPESHAENANVEGLPRLSVRDRLLMSIDILHQGAWIAMGLYADPGSGEIERNLDDARTAIDCVAFLAEKVEASLDPATRTEIKRLVSDLQVNFVRQSQM